MIPRPSPALFAVLFPLVVGAFAALLAYSAEGDDWSRQHWWTLVLWCLFSAGANLLPVPSQPHVYLSMSAPVNIAIAFVFPAPVAAALVSVGSFSEFELRRKTTPWRAIYNRVQLGMSTAAAAGILHLRPGAVIWTVLAATAAYHFLNWGLVAIAVRSWQGTPLMAVLSEALPKNPLGALVYLALGAMGVALGLAGERVGLWAVVFMLFPLIGARQAVRAAQDIERAERERRLLGDRLIEERERERLRIAADLHDVVLQDLALLQVQADNITVAVNRGDRRATNLAGTLRHSVDSAILDVRSAIENLRRSDVAEAGLAVALERMAGSVARRGGLDYSVQVDEVGEAPPALQEVLYESGQELLVNVNRHARATAVTLGLRQEGGDILLSVADDGVGIHDRKGPGGQGLAIMRQRIASWGGSVEVDGEHGGTRVTIRVPAEWESSS